jgi:hypothetical protein
MKDAQNGHFDDLSGAIFTISGSINCVQDKYLIVTNRRLI